MRALDIADDRVGRLDLHDLAPGVTSPHRSHRSAAANDPHYPARRPSSDLASRSTLYEEFHPFGTTSYAANDAGIEVSAKRYRYIGKERDEETGLYHLGARYYASWLARWIAADPHGLIDGLCRYAYARGNPTRLIDPGGRASAPALSDSDIATLQRHSAEVAANALHYNIKYGEPKPQGPRSEQAEAAAEQRAKAQVERAPPTQAELEQEAAAERQATQQAARRASFQPGAHLDLEPPNPIAFAAAEQALGVALTVLQGVLAPLGGEIDMERSTPELREAAESPGAAITQAAAVFVPAAVKGLGPAATPRPTVPGDARLPAAPAPEPPIAAAVGADPVRLVRAVHHPPSIRLAEQEGLVVPRGGTATIEEHTLGSNTASDYTSWLPDTPAGNRLARQHAITHDRNGIVVAAEVADSRVITPPLTLDPGEVLIKGVVEFVKRIW